ncbi:MAG: phosphoadenylyl-sulfate reductase [Flavisolibacter sp.]
MSIPLQDRFLSLQQSIKGRSIAEVLQQVSSSFPGAVTFSTSFSFEDQVITDLISRHAPDISFFTLDTGRLFPETYSTWSRTLEHYPIKIRAFYPEEAELQDFVSLHGPNAFYSSPALRKNCCHIRKVVPLGKALQHQAVWVTGLRAAHSPDREHLASLEWDEVHQIIKYHPLLHWTTEEVKGYINENKVPYNSLHDKGFVSIGCAPCTRAIGPGESFRAGRWWWEDNHNKECGLHIHGNAISIHK